MSPRDCPFCAGADTRLGPRLGLCFLLEAVGEASKVAPGRGRFQVSTFPTDGGNMLFSWEEVWELCPTLSLELNLLESRSDMARPIAFVDFFADFGVRRATSGDLLLIILSLLSAAQNSLWLILPVSSFWTVWCNCFVTAVIETMEYSESLRTSARSTPPIHCTERHESEKTDLGVESPCSCPTCRKESPWPCWNLGEIFTDCLGVPVKDLDDLGV
eukprot:GGOE01027301.1.p2 GENE.GGOE01027301.1~~GGOE01027301.1.p2  ORF type:complete len:216 (+),score=11.06 GGOE01027301.1:1439-2086(+)